MLPHEMGWCSYDVHRSVGAVPGSIAFVLSQDGPVQGIARCEDTIYFSPDWVNTVFVE